MGPSLLGPLASTLVLGMFAIANGGPLTSAGVCDPDPIPLLIEIVPLSLLDSVYGSTRRFQVSIFPDLLDLLDLAFFLPVAPNSTLSVPIQAFTPWPLPLAK